MDWKANDAVKWKRTGSNLGHRLMHGGAAERYFLDLEDRRVYSVFKIYADPSWVRERQYRGMVFVFDREVYQEGGDRWEDGISLGPHLRDPEVRRRGQKA